MSDSYTVFELTRDIEDVRDALQISVMRMHKACLDNELVSSVFILLARMSLDLSDLLRKLKRGDGNA